MVSYLLIRVLDRASYLNYRNNRMSEIEDARKIASVEIENAFGHKTAMLYDKYFADKDLKEVLSTLEDLLSRIIGPRRTSEKMIHIQDVLKMS